jgi:hypothetical protein
MSIKKRKQIKFKQRVKRHKKRLKLSQKGLDPDKFYHGGYYVGCKEES